MYHSATLLYINFLDCNGFKTNMTFSRPQLKQSRHQCHMACHCDIGTVCTKPEKFSAGPGFSVKAGGTNIS